MKNIFLLLLDPEFFNLNHNCSWFFYRRLVGNVSPLVVNINKTAEIGKKLEHLKSQDQLNVRAT